MGYQTAIWTIAGDDRYHWSVCFSSTGKALADGCSVTVFAARQDIADAVETNKMDIEIEESAHRETLFDAAGREFYTDGIAVDALYWFPEEIPCHLQDGDLGIEHTLHCTLPYEARWEVDCDEWEEESRLRGTSNFDDRALDGIEAMEDDSLFNNEGIAGGKS